MPSYIIKPSKDVDFYIMWSTVVDSPVAWGTLEELQKELSAKDVASDRLIRVHTTGSSLPSGEKGWNDTDALFFVREIGPTPFFVTRENLQAFCESLDPIDDNIYDVSLTTPAN